MGKVKSPVWHYPAVWNGRIAPSNSVPQDAGTAQGYYHYYEYQIPNYIYYYAGEGQSHVFCLGSDELNLPINRLKLDDTISVQQDFDIATPQQLLKFCWHFRLVEALPQSRDIINNGTVSFLNGGLLSYSETPVPSWALTEGTKGIYIPTPDSPFTQSDNDRVCSISGATDTGNNGTWRISTIPDGVFSDPTGSSVTITGGKKAVLECDSLTARVNDSGVTVRMHGLNWVARAYADTGSGWEETLQLIEAPNHTWYRNQLAFHLSKYSGAIRIKFELKLEKVA